MDLTRVSFNYQIKDKTFSRLNYDFSVQNKDIPSTELVKLAKTEFTELEQILDQYYTGKGFTKQQNGDISSSIISCGFDYSNRHMGNLFWSKNFRSSTTLRLDIHTYSGTYPTEFSISIANYDADMKRLFRVHDTIISLPDMNISAAAKHEIDTINFLRTQNFDMNDINKYLALPNK